MQLNYQISLLYRDAMSSLMVFFALLQFTNREFIISSMQEKAAEMVGYSHPRYLIDIQLLHEKSLGVTIEGITSFPHKCPSHMSCFNK